ncbi:MAG: hypothetical protein ACTSU5_07740 [Promethearchaeota archaeon]
MIVEFDEEERQKLVDALIHAEKVAREKGPKEIEDQLAVVEEVFEEFKKREVEVEELNKFRSKMGKIGDDSFVLKTFGNVRAKRVKYFPYLEFEPKVTFLWFCLIVGTFIPALFGRIFFDLSLNGFLTVSFISSIIGIVSLFFESEFLHSIIWAMLPGFVATTIYSLVMEPFSLKNHLLHLPLYIICIYYIWSVFENRGTRWWMIPISTLGWIFYLSLMAWVNPSYYGFAYPYEYYIMAQTLSASGTLSTAIFYVLNKRETAHLSILVDGDLI